MRMLSLTNGDHLPALGLGTWKSKPGDVYDAVREALRIGYRHIDCAAIYGNEAEIGQAFRDAFAAGDVRREELWVTSKLWNNAHRREDVGPALQQTLSDLQLDYLNLYLIHWPIAFQPDVMGPKKPEDFISLDELPVIETWRGLEAALEAGLTRHIGVSNFSIPKLKDLLEQADHRPEVNQIELHPFLQQPRMKAFCDEENIILTAYSPLGSKDRSRQLKREDEPDLLAHPAIGTIAQRHGITPAQVLLAWAVNRGTAVIPKSVNPRRLRENLAAADILLTGVDMDEIAALDRHYRFVHGEFWVMEGAPYTLANLWDEGELPG